MTALENFQTQLETKSLDLAIINDPKTIEYFVGFESDPMERILLLFISKDQSLLFAPSLEAEDAKAVVSIPVVSYEDGQNPWEIINQEVFSQFSTINTLGIDYSTLTVDKLTALKNTLDQSDFVNIQNLVNQQKLIKSFEEKQALMASGQVADKALQIGIDALEVGISEQEVVAKIEYEMKKLGVTDMSFPTMVLFGDHAGSPHGNPGDRKLQENEFVLFDLGVVYKGYASDMTRTVYFGSEDAITDRERLIYNTVLKAQVEPQESVRPGMTASQLDNQARSIIEEAGFGDYFIHRLGHGLGQTAHEFPSIDSSNQDELKAGMAFSIEPGIYIPGEIGIRIEDCLYLTDDGAQAFTHFDKSLQVIPVK